jgi:hypothetical protein
VTHHSDLNDGVTHHSDGVTQEAVISRLEGFSASRFWASRLWRLLGLCVMAKGFKARVWLHGHAAVTELPRVRNLLQTETVWLW